MKPEPNPPADAEEGPSEVSAASAASERFAYTQVGEGFARRSAIAAAAAMVGQGLQLVLTLGAVMVLARLLTPEDFGVVAMAMTLIAFTGVIRDLGLPTSTVFESKLTAAQVSTLFWINSGFGLLLAVGVVGVGPWVAELYDEPRLTPVFWLLSTLLVFSGLGAQHEALLKREMRFGAQSTAATVATAVGLAVSLGLAFSGWGYWALAVQQPVETATRTGLICWWAGWVPGRPRYRTGLWPMIWFAADVTGYRVVTHLGKHLDRILLSVSAGPASVGLYSLADRWASMPAQVIYGRLGSVATSMFTRLRDQPARLRSYYRLAMRLLWSVMLPLLTGVLLEAEAVLMVLAGPQWTEAVVLLRILSLAALALAVSQTTKWMYLAEGRTRGQLLWGLVAAGVTAAGVAGGVGWGVEGVAIGFSAATVLLAPLTMGVWLRGSVVTAGDVAGAGARPAAATLIMAAVWWLLPTTAGSATGSATEAAWLVRLLWVVPVLGAVYLGAWLALPGGSAAWREMREVIRTLRRPGGKGKARPSVIDRGGGGDGGGGGGVDERGEIN